MRVAVKRIGPGLHPREAVISVTTKNGLEELSVDEGLIVNDTIEVGWPVGQQNGFYLFELPQETFRGYWRVWVPKSDALASEELLRA